MTVPVFSVRALAPLGRPEDAALAAPATAQLEGGENDPVLADCVAALAVIRNSFEQAHLAVEARYRRFAADCEQLVGRIEGAT